MTKANYIVGREELLRLVRRLTESFYDDESPIADISYVGFMEDLAALVTTHLGGDVVDVTLHRKKIGEIAVKVLLDDQDPHFGVWMEHMREH